MSKELLHDNWRFSYQSVERKRNKYPTQEVVLPHDASIRLSMQKDIVNGVNKGCFPNANLLYTRKLTIDAEDRGKQFLLQFDGVYANAKVYVNNNMAGQSLDGYGRFYVDMTPYLNYGEENEIIVESWSDDDSRWYTGTGIYRDVYLIKKSPVHIKNDSVKIRTISCDDDIAVLEASLSIQNKNIDLCVLETIIEFYDKSGKICAKDSRKVTIWGNSQEDITSRIYMSTPQLWNTDAPNLYHCVVKLVEGDLELDREEISTGIRTLSVDPLRGLRINGKPVKLYGGCIHHSNGILGSAAFKSAEYRKVKLLKDAGYNAIRSAHNPCSGYLLEACDYYGMLVMNELTDVWNKSKTPHDLSNSFELIWKDMIRAMVDVSYNHPSVIMYSIGNEIKEIGDIKGCKLARVLANEVRNRDNSRYVTCGINGLYAMSMKLSVPDVATGLESKESKSLEINAMMSEMTTQMSKIQCSDAMLEATRESSEVLDIVGYNYAEDKQLIEMERFTNRVCVGSETFPASIAKNWKLIEENPSIIGDFTWTSWDYLGEAGIGKNGLLGQWHEGLFEGYPYKLANCGDLDINGDRRSQSYYREITVGLRKAPFICVENPARHDQAILKTPWSWTDGVDSWSWKGHEGNPVHVEIYGKGDEASLVVNGVEMGRKSIPQETTENELAFCVIFDTIYQPGNIEAIIYEKNVPTGSCSIKTAADEIQLLVEREDDIPGVASDIIFYRVALSDNNGIIKTDCDRMIHVSVEGAGVLQGFGSADPICTESFCTGYYPTYYGRALLAVRPFSTGKINICISAEGCEDVII